MSDHRIDRNSPGPGDDYPWVENKRAPFVAARSALPMINLGLISSAGAYLDGTEPFDANAPDGDVTFREIPTEIEAGDLQFVTRGYDGVAVGQDLNSQIPLERLAEFTGNGIIGQLNPAFWSFSGFIPNAARLIDEMLPKLVERLKRYQVQAALLIPASRLCHQSVALTARAIEASGIPTMTLCVDKEIMEMVRAPRAAFYKGELGSVAGKPLWPEHQRRVLDEALRWLEPIDQPGVFNLGVEMETGVEHERGER
jgi:D-proline reductase (dithiol) PrdB